MLFVVFTSSKLPLKNAQSQFTFIIWLLSQRFYTELLEFPSFQVFSTKKKLHSHSEDCVYFTYTLIPLLHVVIAFPSHTAIILYTLSFRNTYYLLVVAAYSFITAIMTITWEFTFLIMNWNSFSPVSRYIILIFRVGWGFSDFYTPYVFIQLWNKSKELREPDENTFVDIDAMMDDEQLSIFMSA